MDQLRIAPIFLDVSLTVWTGEGYIDGQELQIIRVCVIGE